MAGKVSKVNWFKEKMPIMKMFAVGNMSAYVYWWLNNTDVNSLIDR